MVKPAALKVTKDDPDADLLVSFGAGDTIFREGQAGDQMYVVESGQVEIVRSFAGEERQLTVLEAGDFFGEMSVLEELPRSATARAASDCRLLPVDAATFDHMLRDHPEITARMLRKLSRRLREYDEAQWRAQEVAAGALADVARGDADVLQPVIPGAAEPRAAEAPPPVTPEKTAAHLVHAATGSSFAIALDRKNVIGRFDPVTRTHPEVDLRELDSQRSLSRRHARIWAHDGEFFVREEVGVGNGTYLEGRRLTAGEDYKLGDGDRLRLGLVELVFRVGEEG